MHRLLRRMIPLLVLLLLFTLPALGDEGSNLLKNSSFEQIAGDGMPVDWSTEAWFSQEGYTYYSTSEDAHDGSHSAVVNNVGQNDARFTQTVRVEPESLYRLSGWIKTDGMDDAGWGANLSVSGVYASTEGCFHTDGDWQYVEMYGETGPDQTEVTVYVRVGGYSGESLGKAQFDSISLVKVDNVPGDGTAKLWFYPQSNTVHEEEPDTDEAKPASPFWPWLLVLSTLYAIAGICLLPWLRLNRHALQSRRVPAFFVAGLIISFVFRWWLACRVPGYQVDINCFRAWGGTMASVGPGGFYTTTSFCDYPPAYVYIMGLNQVISNGIHGMLGYTPAWLDANVILRVFPMLCDMAISCLMYSFACERRFSREQAGTIGLLVAFNPVLIINSAAWGQIDSVLALLLMLVAILAIRRRWILLMPMYMLAILVKPQALMLGFLGLAAIVMTWVRHREDRRPMLIGTGIALITALVIVLPFSGGQPITWLFELYGNTLSSYAHATINTANLYYLFNGNWNPIENPAAVGVSIILALLTLGWGVWCLFTLKKGQKKLFWLEPALMGCFVLFFAGCAVMQVSWSVVGYGAMALAFAMVLPMFLRAGKLELLPLAGGMLFLLMYVLGIKMHERYLFPALVFFAMSFALRRDWRTMCLLLFTSAVMFVNEGIVLDNSVRLGSAAGHLNNDTYTLNMILSALNVLVIPLGLWDCMSAFYQQTDETLPEHVELRLPLRRYEQKPAGLDSFRPDPRLHWKRLDTILVCAVTVLYAIVAFWNLGSTKAPQRAWTSTTPEERMTIDLGRHYDNFSMLYYCGVSYSDFFVETSDDGENWSEPYWVEMAQGQCYRWKYLMPCTGTSDDGHRFSSSSTYAGVELLNGRYVRVTANQINLVLKELIFRESSSYVNADNNTVPTSGERIRGLSILSRENANEESSLYSDPNLIIDEQDVMDGGLEPGWYTGTYFDEIYHARTAYEHLHGTVPYETTHPPLGKVIMGWFVGIFGMTPFGWRFAGTLAGVLMLPVMYLLGKQLTKKTSVAFAAMTILALDCMHFTQTRIATIDSFPVLFIIASYLFMVRFMQRDITAVPVKKLIPDLALSGFFAGCAIASKWIGLYSGVGLALLFFWTCARHILLMKHARIRLDEANGTMSAGRKASDPLTKEERAALTARCKGIMKRLMILCAWCVLFFVAVPVIIYLLSYVPYFAYAKPRNLSSFIDMVIRAQTNMYNYHSTPGLGMDHPFYSPWYEWPVIGKPMYYAMAYYMKEGVSLAMFCFGNPAVWYVGIAGIAFTLFTWAKRHVYQLDGSESPLHMQACDWNVNTAFVLIGLLAQFLPWVLVPRGTYIYHYFASIPFLVLGTCLMLNWLIDRFGRAGRIILYGYIVICLAMFVAWYPYASGAPTPIGWLDFMSKWLHVYHS